MIPKKQFSFENALEKMEGNILDRTDFKINSTRDEFLSMKDAIIKCLQGENELLYSRCSKLAVLLEPSVNQVEWRAMW